MNGSIAMRAEVTVSFGERSFQFRKRFILFAERRMALPQK